MSTTTQSRVSRRRGCGQVSTVDAKTGQARPSRTSYGRPGSPLSADGTRCCRPGTAPGDVALGHGPDACPTAHLTPGSAGPPASPGVPAGVGGGKFQAVSVLEACPKTGRPAVDAASARRRRRHAQPEIRAAARRRRMDSAPASSPSPTPRRRLACPPPKPTVNIIDETGATSPARWCPCRPVTERDNVAGGDLISGGPVIRNGVSATDFATATRSPRRAPIFRWGPRPMMAGRLLVPSPAGYDVFEPGHGNGVEQHSVLGALPSQAGGPPTRK